MAEGGQWKMVKETPMANKHMKRHKTIPVIREIQKPQKYVFFSHLPEEQKLSVDKDVGKLEFSHADVTV